MEHHPGKPAVIIDRGYQPGASRLKGYVLSVALQSQMILAERLEPARFLTPLVIGCKAVALFLRHNKSRILHAKGLKNLLLQELSKFLAGSHLHNSTQHIGRQSVSPAFSRMETERNLRNFSAITQSIRRMPRLQLLLDFPEQLIHLPPGLASKIGVCQPRCHGQQIPDIDLASGRNQTSVRLHYLTILKFRNIL